MPGSKRFLHPEAIKRIARLEVRARHIVEGFLSGMHRSPYFGQSVEFLQHREYVTGDDLRHVDWKVWARQDRLYVKQYEEETNLRCTLLVDISNSMAYGNGPLNKYEYACTLACSLAYLILRQQDKTDMHAILRQVAESSPRRGLMVLVSDLLTDRAGLFRGLRLLRQRGHDVLIFHVMDDEELDFPFNGPMRFEVLELPEHLNCNPRALREGYLNSLQAFLDEVRRECARNSCDYALVRTSEPLDAALATFLSKRLAVMNRN